MNLAIESISQNRSECRWRSAPWLRWVGCCNGCLCPRGINVVLVAGGTGIMRKQCADHIRASRPRPCRVRLRPDVCAHKVSLW